MTDMIERMARAVRYERYLSWHSEGADNPDDVWDRSAARVHDECRREARAALLALREPTEEMIEAVTAESDRMFAGRDWACMVPRYLRQFHQAMIDTALKGGEHD